MQSGPTYPCFTYDFAHGAAPHQPELNDPHDAFLTPTFHFAGSATIAKTTLGFVAANHSPVRIRRQKSRKLHASSNSEKFVEIGDRWPRSGAPKIMEMLCA